MNLYGFDYSAYDLSFVDPSLVDYLSPSHDMIIDRRHRESEVESLLKLSNSLLKDRPRTVSPPKQRHDGTSPLPLGMDWSPPPRTWDGPTTIWPHDFHTGWSYCVTIPTWSILAESEGSETGVFYRVQVGLQSPEGVTTTREVLRRFRDFLKLSSDLKQSFCKKKLPLPPPKGLFRVTSKTALKERRCALEDWMTKVLTDIELSRSAPVACFLELEAVARLSFSESSDGVPCVTLSCSNSCSSDVTSTHSDAFVPAGTSALASFHDSASETSHHDSEQYVKDGCSDSGKGNQVNDLAIPREAIVNEALPRKDNPKPDDISNSPEVQNVTSSKCSKSRESSISPGVLASLDIPFAHDAPIVLPMSRKQQSQLVTATEQQLILSTTDIEDLIARLNIELSVRQHLTMKVKDLETELESTKKSAQEHLEQATSIEKDRITKMQWDMEELRRKCMEMELQLKAKQVENTDAEATKNLIIKEYGTLQKFDSTIEQLKNLQKCHEEAELKSKSDVKLLVKEVKSLRNSESELRQELERVAKERTEFETRLQKERVEREHANAKLLQECRILRRRLEEFSVSFLIDQENKLKMDAWSSPDALDILATSEIRIRHLLEEAQALAQGVATPVTSSSDRRDDVVTADHELRKMLIDVLVDSASMRKQAYSLLHCALSTTVASLDCPQMHMTGERSTTGKSPNRPQLHTTEVTLNSPQMLKYDEDTIKGKYP